MVELLLLFPDEWNRGEESRILHIGKYGRYLSPDLYYKQVKDRIDDVKGWSAAYIAIFIVYPRKQVRRKSLEGCGGRPVERNYQRCRIIS